MSIVIERLILHLHLHPHLDLDLALDQAGFFFPTSPAFPSNLGPDQGLMMAPSKDSSNLYAVQNNGPIPENKYIRRTEYREEPPPEILDR